MINETELALIINRCIDKDLYSQELLYRNFYGYALGVCLRYSANRDDARNIVNAGFLKIFTKLDKYEPDKPFKFWLGRIMANTAIDHYRSELKNMHLVDISEVEEGYEDALVQQKLDYEELIALVQQLPASYRTVFSLFAIDGYTHEEISKKLKISVGASKSNLFKARKKLQELLKKTVANDHHIISIKDYHDPLKKAQNK